MVEMDAHKKCIRAFESRQILYFKNISNRELSSVHECNAERELSFTYSRFVMEKLMEGTPL